MFKYGLDFFGLFLSLLGLFALDCLCCLCLIDEDLVVLGCGLFIDFGGLPLVLLLLCWFGLSVLPLLCCCIFYCCILCLRCYVV